MKKFAFSLHALFEMKKAQKDRLQTEYAAAKAELDKALHEKDELKKAYVVENDLYEAKGKDGIMPRDMETYAVYFEELQRAIAVAENEVSRRQNAVSRKQAELVENLKEIKTLEKLRQKQYLSYLAEAEKQETAARDEILAFKISEKTMEMGKTGTA